MREPVGSTAAPINSYFALVADDPPSRSSPRRRSPMPSR
jgi:hypothetical protein